LRRDFHAVELVLAERVDTELLILEPDRTAGVGLLTQDFQIG